MSERINTSTVSQAAATIDDQINSLQASITVFDEAMYNFKNAWNSQKAETVSLKITEIVNELSNMKNHLTQIKSRINSVATQVSQTDDVNIK